MPRTSGRREEHLTKTERANEAWRSRKRKADVATCLQDLDEISEEQAMKPFQEEVCWSINTNYASPCIFISSSHKNPDSRFASYSTSNIQYKFKNVLVTPTRASPLPVFCWANGSEVWNVLLKKDQIYLRDKDVLQKHPLLQPKMRTILLDWLMEVCEVYKLHRETFYLAQDYFDRFMATQNNVVKTRLQLIGISALFIAAKLEEIYPPKLHHFAFVTDGACTEEEILNMELVILKALKWSLCPVTIVSWLNIYMQVAYLKEIYKVLVPQYPQEMFIQVMELDLLLMEKWQLQLYYFTSCAIVHKASGFEWSEIEGCVKWMIPFAMVLREAETLNLLDLCILDLECLEFTSGVVAASALYYFTSCAIVHKASGFEWSEIEGCVKWMIPFAMVLREAGSLKLKKLKGVCPENMHNIQTHSNCLSLLDKAHSRQAMLLEQSCAIPSGILTPPQSSKKQHSWSGSL